MPIERTRNTNGRKPTNGRRHSPEDQLSNVSWRIFRIMAEFVEAFEVMAPIGPALSIFGSARTRPHEPMYQAAEETARLLARDGLAVITGGGPGIMEAANKGAFEAGGTSIGLNITLPQEQESNRYQTLSLDFHYFYARKVMFVKYASAFICFPGGFGTLDEFFEVLTLVQTLKVEPYPIVLYGSSYWTGLKAWLEVQLLGGKFIDPEDIDIFRIVDSPRDAVRLVKQGIKKPWWRPLDHELQKATAAPEVTRNSKPIETPATAQDTGEGTRYGTRPKRTGKKHAAPGSKAEQ